MRLAFETGFVEVQQALDRIGQVQAVRTRSEERVSVSHEVEHKVRSFVCVHSSLEPRVESLDEREIHLVSRAMLARWNGQGISAPIRR
jgi:hypothetical protein